MDVNNDGTMGQVKTADDFSQFKQGDKVKGTLFADKKILEAIKAGKIEAPPVIITDPKVLRCKSRKTSLKEIEELDLVNKIKKALPYAWTRGYGLAAIQIGIPIQAAWYRIDLGKGYSVERLIFNPKIVSAESEMAFPQEGCLSVPGKFMVTKRYSRVKVLNGDDRIIIATGIEAIVLQHEIGHMEGKLCLDFEIKKREAKVGRNDPCPCGSGKKHKKCCLK